MTFAETILILGTLTCASSGAVDVPADLAVRAAPGQTVMPNESTVDRDALSAIIGFRRSVERLREIHRLEKRLRPNNVADRKAFAAYVDFIERTREEKRLLFAAMVAHGKTLREMHICLSEIGVQAESRPAK